MKLSEYKFKHVNLGGIRSSIELMDEFISEKYDLLVIEPYFNFTLFSRRVTDIKEYREFMRKFRRENPQDSNAEELESCIYDGGMEETLEDIRDFSVVVTRTVKDKRDLCGRLTMTDLRRGYWGWSSRCIYHVDSDSLAIHWEKKIFEEQFRKGDEPKNLFQSLKEFQYDHEHEKLEAGVIYELRHPVVLKAQTSSDRDYYCWGGNKYGDTHSFYITGVVTSSYYSPIVR